MRIDAIAQPLVRLALTEDLGGGDVTTEAVVAPELRARAHIEAREAGVLAGSDTAAIAFQELDPDVAIRWLVREGGDLKPGLTVAQISGRARGILSAERVALNFLQRLSGVATRARAFARAVEGSGVAILDTRKTTPGLRMLEKLAVRAGGAGNHRFGLFDAVLLKENHVRAAGGFRAAIERARAAVKENAFPIVVEVRTPAEAVEVGTIGVDRVLLDNFTPAQVVDAVKRLGAASLERPPEIEVSGGITLANVKSYAIPGVSCISVGALTHSAPALDLSLLIDALEPAP
jgi:nicotinate-nucleotide pyrophosphorylase (carboxylating)